MEAEMLKGFLRIGMFVGVIGALMVPLQPAGSAELYLSLCSAGIGLFLILGVVIVMRLMK